jgi:hypothetical protein
LPALNGELGVLFKDEQIGGFYDWELDLSLLESSTSVVPKIRLTYRRLFFIKPHEDGEYLVRFYQLKGRLVLIQENPVILSGDQIRWMNS